MPEIAVAPIGEWRAAIGHRVLDREMGDRCFETADVVQRARTRHLKRRQYQLKRMDLGPGLVVPLAREPDVAGHEVLHPCVARVYRARAAEHDKPIGSRADRVDE